MWKDSLHFISRNFVLIALITFFFVTGIQKNGFYETSETFSCVILFVIAICLVGLILWRIMNGNWSIEESRRAVTKMSDEDFEKIASEGLLFIFKTAFLVLAKILLLFIFILILFLVVFLLFTKL